MVSSLSSATAPVDRARVVDTVVADEATVTEDVAVVRDAEEAAVAKVAAAVVQDVAENSRSATFVRPPAGERPNNVPSLVGDG